MYAVDWQEIPFEGDPTQFDHLAHDEATPLPVERFVDEGTGIQAVTINRFITPYGSRLRFRPRINRTNNIHRGEIVADLVEVSDSGIATLEPFNSPSFMTSIRGRLFTQYYVAVEQIPKELR